MKNAVRALLLAAVLAAGGFSQGADTAYVPVRANVGASVKIEPSSAALGVGQTRSVTANRADTLRLILNRTVSITHSQQRQSNILADSYGRGGVSLELHPQSFDNAEISLFSVGGKRVMRGRASASNGGAINISRANIARGVYLLSVKGVGGGSFAAKLTHQGGMMNISASFVGEDAPAMKKASADYGVWTVAASAAGYIDTSYTFSPVMGMNPPHSITLRQTPPPPDGGTRFEPEMLGLAPGATAAGLNINWISTNSAGVGGNQAQARLFDANGGLIETFTGKAANFNFSSSSGKRSHKVTVTGLSPNTAYKYSVSNNGSDWSHEYGFKTPPAGDKFSFAAVADPQITDGNQDSNTNPKSTPSTTAQGWKETVEKIAAAGVSLIVSAGDQVDAYTYTASQYEKFFAPEPLRGIAFAPVMGNHDSHGQYFDHFNVPNLLNPPANAYSYVSAGVGNYYYLYNNILFVGLNTGSQPYPDGINSKSAAQPYVDAYETAIKAAKTAHSGYDWLIVTHHKSTTSISSHACDLELQFFVEAGLEKIMTDHGVDLVITGHDHIYVRSHLMKWDDAKKYSVRSEDKGAIYLTLTTASGVKFYPPFFILDDDSNEYSDYTEFHPVLADGTRGVTEFRKASASNTSKWPLSTNFYPKPSGMSYIANYTPNYTICEVDGKSMKITTRATVTDAVVDEFTIAPKGGR